jgi:pyrroline-5-carboxylate reductase
MTTISILGNGNMAMAIAKGLEGKFHPQIFARNPKTNQFPLSSFAPTADDIIIIAVKPYALKDVAPYITKGKTIISILAGTTIETIQELTHVSPVVRAMPNMGEKYSHSFTALTGDIAQKELATTIFSAIGQTIWLSTQKELDISTAIAGSGPAFLALVSEAIMDGGVLCGLGRNDSTIITQGLFESFASLSQNLNPAEIKNSVMSPGGTTASGVASLEGNGIRGAFIEAIQASFAKAEILAKKS